jgi:ADP-ribose pyrophosphatase YjhB (NUDIX family)
LKAQIGNERDLKKAQLFSFPISNHQSPIPMTEYEIATVDWDIYRYIYHDTPLGFDTLPNINQVYGLCFTKNGQILLGYCKNIQWTILGGGIEKGESFWDCLERELVEESNHRLLKMVPIGYQKGFEIENPDNYVHQLRYACLVEPIGEFVQDGDVASPSIIKIGLFSPEKVPQVWNWGRSSEIMLKRGLQVYHSQFSLNQTL